MKILPERQAYALARNLGITQRTLERGYAIFVPRDENIKKAWRDSDDARLFYKISWFLADHPTCRSFLEAFGIDDFTRIRAGLDADRVMDVFHSIFEAKLSFDDDDRPSGTLGYAVRTGREWLIAVRCHEWDGDCVRTESGTVIHEYGHYAELRTVPDATDLSNDPYCDRETSFRSALLLVDKYCAAPNNDYQRRIADELVAWTNAIWIAWLAGLDPRTAVLGGAIDTAGNESREVFAQVFRTIALLACNRKHAADYFERFGPFKLVQIYNTVKNDRPLCIQIDRATQHIFDRVLAGISSS